MSSLQTQIYEVKESCNCCGGRYNEIVVIDSEDLVIHECETKCIMCGFLDYWSHGQFISSQNGHNSCEKY